MKIAEDFARNTGEAEFRSEPGHNGEVYPSGDTGTRSQSALMLIAGILGIVGAGFVIAGPQLGVVSATTCALSAGLGSAIVTAIAKKVT